MVLPLTAVVGSENETIEVARNFSKLLNDGDIVLLIGDLGVGKTFFVKSVCNEYGIGNVSSPTFAIVNEYVGIRKIYHFDFYRIRKSRELFDIGYAEYLNDEAIKFIEWADLYPEVLPRSYYKVEFEFVDETKRKLIITKNG